MTSEEIKSTDFYKSLSKLSLNDRGKLFDSFSTDVEKTLKVKLVKHPYTNLGMLNSDNIIISYQENWGSHTGPFIALMEFVPQE